MPGVRPLASSALPERQSPPPNLTPNPPTLSFNAHIGITKLSIHTKHTYNANRYNRYVCMHACRHVCMYVCMYTYVSVCICMHTCMCIYIYVYATKNVHSPSFTHACIHTCINPPMHAYMSLCIYIYT